MLQISVVMNGITHGLGVILCVIGTIMMRQRVADLSANTRIRYVKKQAHYRRTVYNTS
jgi:hypothetical protein